MLTHIRSPRYAVGKQSERLDARRREIHERLRDPAAMWRLAALIDGRPAQEVER